MPRGQRKRGEFKCTIWFENGDRFELGSHRMLTDVEIAASIRENLLPIVEMMEQPKAADAVGLSVDDSSDRPRA